MRFSTSGFFSHGSVSLGPLSIPLGLLRIFTKIRGDIHNFVLIAGINDTSDKLFEGVTETGHTGTTAIMPCPRF
jgi:hypothetical protein